MPVASTIGGYPIDSCLSLLWGVGVIGVLPTGYSRLQIGPADERALPPLIGNLLYFLPPLGGYGGFFSNSVAFGDPVAEATHSLRR